MAWHVWLKVCMAMLRQSLSCPCPAVVQMALKEHLLLQHTQLLVQEVSAVLFVYREACFESQRNISSNGLWHVEELCGHRHSLPVETHLGDIYSSLLGGREWK